MGVFSATALPNVNVCTVSVSVSGNRQGNIRIISGVIRHVKEVDG